MSITAFYFRGEGLLIYYLYLNSSSLVNIKLSWYKEGLLQIGFHTRVVDVSVPMISCTKDGRGVWSKVDAYSIN